MNIFKVHGWKNKAIYSNKTVTVFTPASCIILYANRVVWIKYHLKSYWIIMIITLRITLRVMHGDFEQKEKLQEILNRLM